MPRTRLSLVTATAIACACVLTMGCASDPTNGYAFDSAYDSSVRTVAVPIFDNPTYEPGSNSN